jgi:hypothetical protein
MAWAQERDIGEHSDCTLMAWTNFERVWPSLCDRYGEAFLRGRAIKRVQINLQP